jgi:hypothetical protein
MAKVAKVAPQSGSQAALDVPALASLATSSMFENAASVEAKGMPTKTQETLDRVIEATFRPTAESLDLLSAAIKASPRSSYLDALGLERATAALAALPAAEQVTIATAAAGAIRKRDYERAYAILEGRGPDADPDEFAEAAESDERINCAWCGLPSAVRYTHCYHCSRNLRTGELTPIRRLSESPWDAKERKARKQRKQGEPPLPETTRCATHYDKSLLTELSVGGYRCTVCDQYVWPRETQPPTD